MQLQAGRIVGGRYRLERPLASGGMGTIWVATHLQLDIEVAVKFVADHRDADALVLARFEREAKAIARLQSPHVVRAYDYGIEEHTPFLAMELLQGESLQARLRQRRRLPVAEAASLLGQIAKGLAEAHGQGIVHRDLKPANIFLARVGHEEVAKILDFGIAKETTFAATDDETATGMLVGTPRHMSPEQARGGRIDLRSDLWSLAVVIFEAITGERPFDGANIGEIVTRLMVDPIPLPSRRAPELGLEMDRFFEKAFARNPELRFQSALAMATAFERAIVHTPGDANEITRTADEPAVVPRQDETAVLGPVTGSFEATSTAQPRGGRRRPLIVLAAACAVVGAVSMAAWSRARAVSTVTTQSAVVPNDSASAGDVVSNGATVAEVNASAEPTSTTPSTATDPRRAPPNAPVGAKGASAIARPPAPPAAASHAPRRSAEPPATASTSAQPRRANDPFFD